MRCVTRTSLLAVSIVFILSSQLLADPPAPTSRPATAPASMPAVKFANERKLMSLGKDGIFYGQLSPDHKYLLYVVSKRTQQENPRNMQQLVLRDIKTGKDTILPGKSVDDGGGSLTTLTGMMKSLLFTADGKKILIPACKDVEGLMFYLAMYDIAKGKAYEMKFSAGMIWASLDRTGTSVLAYGVDSGGNNPRVVSIDLMTEKQTFAKVTGLPLAGCGMANQLPMVISAEENSRFVLLDTKDLESQVKLDTTAGTLSALQIDRDALWTSNGRWLYYCNWREPKEGDKGVSTIGGGHDTAPEVRIYDCKAGAASKFTVANATPVGPGPGESSMFLNVGDDNQIVLHDAATGANVTVGKYDIRWTDGKVVLFVVGDEKKGYELMIADVVAK